MKVYGGFFENALDRYPSDIAVIVDVLRFSCLAATALHIGIKEILVRKDLDEALELARSLRVPLIAEVEGVKADVADFDNSPTEILSRLSKSIPDRIVVRSSSGALMFEEAVKKGFREVVVGSLVNASAVARYLHFINPSTITIVMAGFKGKLFAIEDLIGAGAIITELINISRDIHLLTDEIITAQELYISNKNRLQELISKGASGKLLIETGRKEDVEFCSKVNIIEKVPRAKGKNKILTNAT